MKHIVEKWDEKLHEGVLWKFYFDCLKIGVLDIETTGLNPARNKFVLGCLYDVTEGEIHQVLAESRVEEPLALAEYMELIDRVDVVVTYNGRKFDMPFIDRRRQATMNALNYLKHEENGGMKMPEGGTAVYDLDLYQVLDKHSALRRILPNLKQKTVEEYMGLWETRADEISGAESVELYNHYEATADTEAEKKILLHNNDDVRQLTKLTKAITKSDFHKAMYSLGFPVKAGGLLLHVNRIAFERDGLAFSGEQLKSSIDYMGFEFRDRPVSSRFIRAGESGRRGLFELKVPLIRQEGYIIADTEAAGISPEAFADYPDSGSGFLVLGDTEGIRYRETNHFIKSFIESFMEEAI
ncbi:MAG: ribonuclease H-like domain-containing protein [Clostridia bacterium]|nr:ribonuclease H-like domain-containing protein [Clostridia bacterium]